MFLTNALIEELGKRLMSGNRDENDLGSMFAYILGSGFVQDGSNVTQEERSFYLNMEDGTTGEWEIEVSSRDRFNWHNPRLREINNQERWRTILHGKDEVWQLSARLAFNALRYVQEAIMWHRLEHEFVPEISVFADTELGRTYFMCGKFVLCISYRSDPTQAISSNGIFAWLDAMENHYGAVSDDDIVCALIDNGNVVISVNGIRYDTGMKRHQFSAMFD
ncbi:hypothetical protein AVT69_gp019 [Pseudomonas phage PhiPA3]|uniref:Uncharacterized protein 019 n=1 Tax=Pseudomonas phage PhiPA3 TaxID=998086 RepID=F8SJQ0_BPPA3|nr:hypothetical protein AVT69_gp019 [Pseudomonas phage PhiPA3]AEH03445.1 hypothetical protein [Pseudomonas phage PhiPA3]